MTAWARAGRTAASPSIGIGGHLAMPPLPHHRAYGSVPRRFGGLCVRQRIHADQPKAIEAPVGEGTMQRARRTQPPRSLRAEDGRAGHLLSDLQATKFSIAIAPRPPLDPDDATQASPYPAVRRCQLVQLAEAEISGPSPQQRVQVSDHPIQAYRALPPRQIARPPDLQPWPL